MVLPHHVTCAPVPVFFCSEHTCAYILWRARVALGTGRKNRALRAGLPNAMNANLAVSAGSAPPALAVIRARSDDGLSPLDNTWRALPSRRPRAYWRAASAAAPAAPAARA